MNIPDKITWKKMALQHQVSIIIDVILSRIQVQTISESVISTAAAIFEKELSQGENNIDVSFNLQMNFLVFYNSSLLSSNLWSGVGTSSLILTSPGNMFDWLTVVSSTEQVFEKELSQAENSINVGFILQNTSLVFVAGKLLPADQWSGVGSYTLELSTPGATFDQLIVVRTCTWIYEKELTEGENNINIGNTIQRGDLIFMNGSLLSYNFWQGVGTPSLTLTSPGAAYDKLIVVKK